MNSDSFEGMNFIMKLKCIWAAMNCSMNECEVMYEVFCDVNIECMWIDYEQTWFIILCMIWNMKKKSKTVWKYMNWLMIMYKLISFIGDKNELVRITSC